MSSNPFAADTDVVERLARFEPERGDAIRAEVADGLSRRHADPGENGGGVLSGVDAAAICARYAVTADDLMLLSLRVAEGYARPPISGFHVGAVGRESGTGNLVFGGNLEFPGAHIGNTVHGEGFVMARAFRRSTSIETLALGEAHPCAHCRQFLSEFASSAKLTLIDPLGHRLTLAQLYPWPFDPAYLGEKGIVAGAVEHPGLALEPADDVAEATTSLLTDLGRRCHTPYGKSPSALVLDLAGGMRVGGGAIESVAFNPTISPIQAAMIDLFAHGFASSDIIAATIATRRGADVDYFLPTVDALAAIAPGVMLRALTWA